MLDLLRDLNISYVKQLRLQLLTFKTASDFYFAKYSFESFLAN